MKKILIATTNPGKFEEYCYHLRDVPIEPVSLAQLGIIHEVVEDGVTFEENAIKKVREYGKLTGLPALNDDSGLAIAALNGEPGVASRTWIGRRMTDDEMIVELMRRMAGVPPDRRQAEFVAAVALFIPPDNVVVERSVGRGDVADAVSPIRIPGYPFRSVVKLEGINKYYSELTEAEQQEYNHRKKVMPQFKAIIKQELL